MGARGRLSMVEKKTPRRVTGGACSHAWYDYCSDCLVIVLCFAAANGCQRCIIDQDQFGFDKHVNSP